MKKITTKIIILITIIIAVVYTIYNVSLNQKKKMENQEYMFTKEKMIATDIRIGVINFDTMNPILSNNVNIQNISRLVFDPLIHLTENFKLEAGLATEWTKLDKTTYLIKLRENVEWQDGKKFNADDVIFTVDMLKSNQSIYSYNVENIINVQKIDQYTIKIITKKPQPYFEYNLIFPIMSSKYFNEKNFNSSKKNENPVGTGMYYISENESNAITLRKNTNWWKKEDLRLDTIKINLYKSINNAITDFEADNVDIITSSYPNIDKYIGESGCKKLNYIGREYDYLAFNCKNQILKNKTIRQAISKAINKEQMIEKVYNKQYTKSNFPLDFGSFLYETNRRDEEYSIEKSKELLKGIKWEEKKQLELLVNKNDNNGTKVAQIIKEQLKEVGINITIIEKSEKQYQKDIQDGNYEIILTRINYGYSPSLKLYFDKENIANYTNEEVIQMLEQIENSEEEEEQKRKMVSVANTYSEDVPYISLYYNTISMICSNKLKGEITPNSYNIFYHIENWYREYDKL